MKTSNKLILAALLLLVISLFSYDYLLKSEFLTGSYKNPYKNFITLKFKNFDTINVNSASAANVKFEQGPFRVRISPDASEFTRVSQQHRTLNIDAVFEYSYQNTPDPYILIISCPKITALKASARYGTNGKIYIDTVVRDLWNMRQVLIDGFKQDSMTISQDYGSRVFLSNSSIGALKAVTGLSPESGPQLNLLNNNHFDNITLDIRNRSSVIINTVPKNKFNYRLDDSARIILNGAAQNIFKKQ
jgi:hypothetical protein